jgi:hypothetical protein
MGVKHVYHAAPAGGDAVDFVRQRLVGKADFGVLESDGSLWVGIKVAVSRGDQSQFTLVIEPLLADTRFLFVDLDAQFPGTSTIDSIKKRAALAERYLVDDVRRYLEHDGEGSTGV